MIQNEVLQPLGRRKKEEKKESDGTTRNSFSLQQSSFVATVLCSPFAHFFLSFPRPLSFFFAVRSFDLFLETETKKERTQRGKEKSFFLEHATRPKA
jgi:hypothetical protein